MMPLSTTAHKSDMAPVARREQSETYLASNPRIGPQNMKGVLRVLEIMVGVIFFHIPDGVMTQARGVEGAFSLDLRWRTRQSREALGHSSGSPKAL